MGDAKRKWAGAAVIVAAVAIPRPVVGAAVDATPLVIHVVDHVHISAGDLRQAEEEVTRIYAAAKVSVRWASSDAIEPEPAMARHVMVVLLCREMAARKIATDHVADGTIGQASSGTGRAYVFYHRVRSVAASASQHFARVLGRVIAHEVGHLMLPHGSHSARGIMQVEVDWRMNAAPRFTLEQAIAIHANLIADRPRIPTEMALASY